MWESLLFVHAFSVAIINMNESAGGSSSKKIGATPHGRYYTNINKHNSGSLL